MATERDRPQRVLVALDVATCCRTALESAVELAARLGAELHGLFVEDVNLLRSADLSVVRQVSLLTACTENFDSGTTRRELCVVAARAEQHLAASATRRDLVWSFRKTRGRVSEVVSEAAEDADVLVVQAGHGSYALQTTGDVAVRAALIAVRKSLLILQPEVRLGRRVLVVYDSIEEGDRLLDTAAGLRDDPDRVVDVLLVGETTEETRALSEAVERWQRDSRVPFRARLFLASTLSQLGRELQDYRSGLLVLAGRCRLLRDREATCLIDAFACPVFVLR
jgi:hypothetical protein